LQEKSNSAHEDLSKNKAQLDVDASHLKDLKDEATKAAT
jgi:hypothetical protein